MKRWNGHGSLVWFIVSYKKKKNNCRSRLLNLGEIFPRMHLCLGTSITDILWVPLRSFVAVKKKKSGEEGLYCELTTSCWLWSRWWIWALWFDCTFLPGWVTAADEEEPHQSPCPPTLSLGMMRSSEPCFKNTFPAKTRHDIAVEDHSLIKGFTDNAPPNDLSI